MTILSTVEVGRSGSSRKGCLSPTSPERPLAKKNSQFESNNASGLSPSGNRRRVLWGCAEPSSNSLKASPTSIEISIGIANRTGRTHAKALAPPEDAR
jgi:hypothetical protein